jgi:hypothetical protein
VADGNIGIGGDPRALLARVGCPLGVHGRAVVELGASTVEGEVVVTG